MEYLIKRASSRVVNYRSLMVVCRPIETSSAQTTFLERPRPATPLSLPDFRRFRFRPYEAPYQDSWYWDEGQGKFFGVTQSLEKLGLSAGSVRSNNDRRGGNTNLIYFAAMPGNGNLSPSVEARDYKVGAENCGMIVSAQLCAPQGMLEPSTFVVLFIAAIGLIAARRWCDTLMSRSPRIVRFSGLHVYSPLHREDGSRLRE